MLRLGGRTGYDGCNTCQFSEGVPGTCTRNVCTQAGVAPFCKRFANGLECSGPTDAQCTWAVVGPLSAMDDNPCPIDVWDRCVGDQRYTDSLTGYPKTNELCSSGITSGKTCMPVGFPEAACTWANQDCPVASGPSGCGAAFGRGVGAPGGPCQNNGQCEAEYGGGYTCMCLGGWTGDNCELRQNGVPVGPYGPDAPRPPPPPPPPPAVRPPPPPPAGSVIVQGAGDEVYNGVYLPDAERGGRPSYLKQVSRSASASIRLDITLVDSPRQTPDRCRL